MEVLVQKNDNLNAIVKVSVQKEDYLSKYENSLKDYSKKVEIKGFRKGKVPTSLVKKMYGPGVFFEEVNKLVSEALDNHIKTENLDILGQPLAKENDLKLDPSNPSDYEFEFEIGLQPQFDLSILSTSTKAVKPVVEIDEELVSKEIDHMLSRYGTQVETDEAIIENDIIHVDIVELENNSPKEGGLTNQTSFGLNILKDASLKKAFLSGKKGAVLTTENIFEEFEKEKDAVAKHILGVKDADVETLGTAYQITIEKVTRLRKAEENQEFYNQVYGEGAVTSNEEWKERIKKDISSYFDPESENRLKTRIMEIVRDNTSMELPNEFLKKWILATAEKPTTTENIENEYPEYEKGIKWQLISDRIFKESGIKITKEEVEETSKDQLRSYLLYNNPTGREINEADIDMLNGTLMAKEDHVKKTFDTLMEQKLFNFIKEKITISEELVKLEDFYKN